MNERRALEQLGGPIREKGDPELSSMLAFAWDRASREEPDTLTHGFHSWPARMHWAIARTVIEAFDVPAVLDPFCGGGTVLVEARVAGRRSIGVDLSPLSEPLCKVKTRTPTEAELSRFRVTAEAVAKESEARVRARVPIQVALPKEHTKWYGPHVLKELGGLLEEIREVKDDEDRRALGMVFSANLVKVSSQRADTAPEETPKRIRKGLTTELFLRKADELAERWRALSEVAKGQRPMLYEGDARRLSILAKDRRVDLILTSPPYGGTYDYADHHARRMAWLGLDDSRLRRFELGARRHLGGEGAAAKWEREVGDMLGSMRAVLRDGGYVVLVMGDAQVGPERVEVPAQLARLAPKHGLELLATASQARSDHKGGRPREEHLAVLLGA